MKDDSSSRPSTTMMNQEALKEQTVSILYESFSGNIQANQIKNQGWDNCTWSIPRHLRELLLIANMNKSKNLLLNWKSWIVLQKNNFTKDFRNLRSITAVMNQEASKEPTSIKLHRFAKQYLSRVSLPLKYLHGEIKLNMLTIDLGNVNVLTLAWKWMVQVY